VVLLILCLVAYAVYVKRHPPALIGDGDYLFCFWNTENFFDDQPNGWQNEPDKDFDRRFARDRAAFAQKVQNLTEVLAALNDGKGPDILALAEVEAESRSAEALVESLNQNVRAGTPPYRPPVLKLNPHGGRNIVTAIITRLPVAANRTQLVGRRLRILEGHIDEGGQDLAVLATHCTSRISDERGDGRAIRERTVGMATEQMRRELLNRACPAPKLCAYWSNRASATPSASRPNQGKRHAGAEDRRMAETAGGAPIAQVGDFLQQFAL
jgi:hypothetical protein